MTLTAAADGSALGNPGPAGWAWYIDDSNWRAGGWPHGTNNMGELKAVLDLLETTADLGEPLRVLCDSQYVINSITRWMKGWKKKGWKKGDGKPVLNVELMKALDAAMEGRDVRFEWVKGHAGHPLNEAADTRANAAARAFQAKTDPQAGPGLAPAAAPAGSATAGAPAGRRSDDGSPDAPAQDAPAQDEDLRPAPGAAVPEAQEHGDPDPDLLSTLDEQSERLAQGRSIGDEVLELERRRISDGLPAASLHPEAVLVGADGRPEEPGDLGVGDPTADVHLVGLLALTRNAVQATVHVLGAAGCAVHSTLWVREDTRNELGVWQLRHHQITLES